MCFRDTSHFHLCHLIHKYFNIRIFLKIGNFQGTAFVLRLLSIYIKLTRKDTYVACILYAAYMYSNFPSHKHNSSLSHNKLYLLILLAKSHNLGGPRLGSQGRMSHSQCESTEKVQNNGRDPEKVEKLGLILYDQSILHPLSPSPLLTLLRLEIRSFFSITMVLFLASLKDLLKKALLWYN